MKRIFILILSLFMLISLFVACAEEANDTGDASSNAVSDDEESTGGAVSDETSENVVFDPTPRELEFSYKLLNVKSMPDEMRGYTVLSIEKFKQLIIESREDLDELIGWMGNNNADSDAAVYFNALPDNYFDEKTLLVTDYTDSVYNERFVSSVYADENGVTVIYSTVFNGNEIIEVGPDPAFMVVELSKKDILGCENFNAIADINDNSIAELEENREILYYNGEYDFENAPERSETGVFEQYTDIPNPLAEYFADNEDSDSAFFLVGLDIDCEDETLVSHKLRQSGFIAAPLKYYPEESSRFSYVGFIKKSGYEALSENESFSTGITWLSNSTNVSDDPDEPDTPDEPDEPDVPDQPSSVIDKSKVVYFTGEYSEIVEYGETATLFERASYSLLEYIDENDPDSETYFFVALKFNRNENAESPIYSEHAVENVLEMGFVSETCKLPLFTLGGQSPHLCGYATADMLNSLENEIGHITYVVWLPDPEDSETWDGYPELIRDIKYSDGRTLEEYLKENTSSREYFFVGLKCGEKDVYKYNLISCNFVYETDEEILEEYKGEYDIVGYIHSNFYKLIKSRFGVEIIWLPEE